MIKYGLNSCNNNLALGHNTKNGKHHYFLLLFNATHFFLFLNKIRITFETLMAWAI